MKKIIYSVLFSVLFFSTIFGQNGLWTKTSDERVNVLEKMDRSAFPNTYMLYQLDFAAFKSQLQQAPMENNEGISNTIISFPNSEGTLERFKIFEAPVMDAVLAANYPDIKS
jgi:hypothetical protein